MKARLMRRRGVVASAVAVTLWSQPLWADTDIRGATGDPSESGEPAIATGWGSINAVGGQGGNAVDANASGGAGAFAIGIGAGYATSGVGVTGGNGGLGVGGRGGGEGGLCVVRS